MQLFLDKYFYKYLVHEVAERLLAELVRFHLLSSKHKTQCAKC